MIGRLQSLAWCIRHTGWSNTVRYKYDRIRLALGVPLHGEMRFQPAGVAYPLIVRRGRSSDMEVYRAIFIEREYEAVKLPDPPKLIFDLGANVGASSIYFLNRFPEARVVAVEPDANNFAQCQRNLAPYGSRAQAVQGAVWSHRTHLRIRAEEPGQGREWAISVEDSPSAAEGSIPAWDLPSLLELVPGAQQIDLLKVDIEGGETKVFDSGSAAWMDRVRNICIELHGPHCDEVFFKALEGRRYKMLRSGELTICLGLRRAQEEPSSMAR